MDKTQVGRDVWIKPNSERSVPAERTEYWTVITDGTATQTRWDSVLTDYALLACGNCFLTKEEAEAAIIKPVDPTPITYKQWVDAGRPMVWAFDFMGDVMDYQPMSNSNVITAMAANRHWLTREAAEAWLARWQAENGSGE